MASRAECCCTTSATPSPGMVVRAFGEKGQSWWGEDVVVQGKNKGAHADKGKGKGWGVPLGSGTSHTGCDKGHQGNHADQGEPVQGTGGVYFLAMQTRASLWRARAGAYILDVGPLAQAARASMQTRASSWRVKARAASPNTSPKPRCGHNGSQHQAKNTWAEQASESGTSGTSEIRSQDKEDEKGAG